jgi:hypothetical protein
VVTADDLRIQYSFHKREKEGRPYRFYENLRKKAKQKGEYCTIHSIQNGGNVKGNGKL